MLNERIKSLMAQRETVKDIRNFDALTAQIALEAGAPMGNRNAAKDKSPAENHADAAEARIKSGKGETLAGEVAHHAKQAGDYARNASKAAEEAGTPEAHRAAAIENRAAARAQDSVVKAIKQDSARSSTTAFGKTDGDRLSKLNESAAKDFRDKAAYHDSKAK
jgi:hypothetical protein